MGRVRRISSKAAAGLTGGTNITAQTQPLPSPAQPVPVGAHRHWAELSQVGNALSPCLACKERKGDNGGCAFLTAMALVFFLQQQGPPGFCFMFYPLSLLKFVFAATILQLLCVNMSPVKVLLLQTSLPVPN